MSRENSPAVTFVIPVYNEEKRIGSCLKSVFSLDYPTEKVEVIIIDGRSSDNTVAVARNYRVRVVFNEKRIIGNAQNIGLGEAKNDIILFLDADVELLEKDWLKKMIAPLHGDPTVAGTVPLIVPKKQHPSISRCYALVQADPFISLTFANAKSVGSSIISKDNYFPIGISLLRKDLILAEGGFKSSLPRMSDVDLTYRLVKHGYKFIIVPKAKIHHLYADSFSSFIRKAYYRMVTFVNYRSYCEFPFIPNRSGKIKFLVGLLSILAIPIVFVRMAKGIRKDRDVAWLYYPLLTFSTVAMYTIILISRLSGLQTLKEFIGLH